jgi:hypothetical protein
VERRRDAELEALRPDRVVIVFAVEPDDVVPYRKAGGLAFHLAAGLDRAVHQAAEHRDLVAELLDGVVELLDRLLRRVHGDDRRRGHTIGKGAEIFGRDDIVGAASGAARLAIADARHPQTAGRIDDCEIEPDLVEALIEEPRKNRSREVARILGRMGPERLLADTAPPPLLDRHRQHAARAAADRAPAAHRGLAADLAQLLGEDGPVFDPVAVGVDNRVVEAGFDLGGGQMGAHGHLPYRCCGSAAVVLPGR